MPSSSSSSESSEDEDDEDDDDDDPDCDDSESSLSLALRLVRLELFVGFCLFLRGSLRGLVAFLLATAEVADFLFVARFRFVAAGLSLGGIIPAV